MRRGTIVLSPFPLTDLSGQKLRPALIVSRSDRPGKDVLLAFITSQHGRVLLPTDLLVPNSHPEFGSTGLKRASIVKLDKLVTVETTILVGELGELPADLLCKANEKLLYALDLGEPAPEATE